MIKIVPTYVAALLLASLGLAFCVGSFKLGFWVDDNPGPGLLPLIVGALMIPTIALALREPIPDDENSFKIQPLVAIALILAYALVLKRAGFVPATVIMLILWIRGFYHQSWLRAVICSVSLMLLGLFIFGYLLKVPMPLFPELS